MAVKEDLLKRAEVAVVLPGAQAGTVGELGAWPAVVAVVAAVVLSEAAVAPAGVDRVEVAVVEVVARHFFQRSLRFSASWGYRSRS